MVTSAFAETIQKLIQDQGVPEMALVVVEHPIAGHNLEGIRKKADAAFPEIMMAATKWQPTGK
jgi:regulator of RNase E activity RraB